MGSCCAAEADPYEEVICKSSRSIERQDNKFDKMMAEQDHKSQLKMKVSR